MPTWLGDFVHTLPAVARLREGNAGGSLTLLIPAAHFPLARLLEVEACVRPASAGYLWARAHLRRRFAVALSARHATRAKLLLAGAGAPLALASQGRGARLLGLERFAVDRHRHQRHDLDLALARLALPPVAAGPFRLSLPDALVRVGLDLRAEYGQKGSLVALLPGARGLAAKRYPADQFAALARLLGEAGLACVAVAGPGEEELAARVALPAGGRVFPATSPLDEVAALLAACDAAVGHDSGLTHLAAVLGAPTVALFGPTDPARTGPVGGATIIRASEHGAASLAELPPAVVAAAVDSLLAARPA
ncbi:MAG: glycosyltransferase family 9 protein [Acidobacteriota bacterium]